ncbi:FAD/NAD(P)-binding domain-containing protein [Penicillium bovifimosum]|uniref:FAD/NAD(P)-binding domain-containing protein n=1 Tax=Penicillium bovifimosum TaxID=126998 RepID=A0A9W9GMN8_9EURO|nr:FAD/NAD(P)-binding domain-containing protein [Penicillium bovifimosum]KAJ5124318.1 FAD/NAD(P)-binding domain-containing protein [Penicillium bovifimosum]
MENHSFDVIVVGGGNAALVAALSAHESGAKVAVLEAATRQERGGNSRFAGAIFRCPHGGMEDLGPLLCESAQEVAKRCTVGPYTAEKFTEDMMNTSHGRADREQMQVVIDKGYETLVWMKEQGVQWQLTLNKFFDTKIQTGVIDLPPGGALMARHEGVGLTDDLWAAVEKTSITVFYDCPAHDLITAGSTVQGVKTRQTDFFIDFYGQVILACGGFEASPRLRRQFLGEGWDLVVVRGSRYNTGTMLEKAIAAGAQACGHWGGCHASPQDLRAPRVGDLSITDKMSRYSYPYSIMVNLEGKRFMDEGEDHFGLTYAKTGAAIGSQPQATAYQIFDQKTLHLLEPRYSTATPIQDDTLDGLALKLGINPTIFVNTVKQFNAAAPPTAVFNPFLKDGNSTGHKLDIPKSNWALPITDGPFVAYGVTCGITFTYGGIKTDTTGRVLSNEGSPMPGLWSAGEMTGGFFYHNYPGGAGLTKGAVFGRIAGQAAAQRAKSVSLL